MKLSIPYYGKEGSLVNIEKLGDNLFRVRSYDKDGKIIVKKVEIDEKVLLKKYVNDLEEYLKVNLEEYDNGKISLSTNSIRKRNIIMLICSIILCFVLPVVGYALKSPVLFLSSMLLEVLTVTIFSYSVMELIYKNLEKEVEGDILLYEALYREKNRIKNKLIDMEKTPELTKFDSIEPVKMNVDKEDKVKKLIKEKE